MMMTTMMIIKC